MLKGKKTKGGGGGSYFTGTLNTTKVKHLSTCKHWKANLEKGKKGKEKEQWRKKEKKKTQKQKKWNKLRFGILPRKQESTWELKAAS